MSYADYELINISSVDDIYSIIDSIKQKADSWCTNFCINKVTQTSHIKKYCESLILRAS